MMSAAAGFGDDNGCRAGELWRRRWHYFCGSGGFLVGGGGSFLGSGFGTTEALARVAGASLVSDCWWN